MLLVAEEINIIIEYAALRISRPCNKVVQLIRVINLVEHLVNAAVIKQTKYDFPFARFNSQLFIGVS